jgi:hypothetical protein
MKLLHLHLIRRGLLVAAALVFSFQTGGLEADTASITGALYKLTMGKTKSQPVAAASVYIHAAGQPSAAWIGPSLTDQFGRFTFYNVPPGQYVLRIFSSTIRLWQQTLNVNPEAKLGSIVIPDVRLVYFTKTSDPSNLAEALSEVQLPYDSEPGKLKIPSNTIWFGDEVSLAQVKKVAMALLGVHASLRAIRKFAVSNDWHAKIIEVGSDPSLAGGRTLSASEVEQAKVFPQATGRSEDQL